MNLDDLTIGQARELAKMFPVAQPMQPAVHPFVGKYVVVRTYSAGVHVGILHSAGEGEAILTRTRRIWSWNDGKTLSCSEIALAGIGSGKMSCEVVSNALTGVIEIIPTTMEAEKCLQSFSAFKA
jgi:hypothetical protein